MNSDSEKAPRGPRASSARSLLRSRKQLGVILAGGLVAVPTETVYGLAADATNGSAVAAIYTAKGRPSINPLICHVADLAMAESLAVYEPARAPPRRTLLAWPAYARAAAPSRLPRARTRHCGPAVDRAAPTTTHCHAWNYFARRATACGSFGQPFRAVEPHDGGSRRRRTGPRIDLIIDGGPCSAGLESTIIAPGEEGAVLLRPGALARSEIELLTGPLSTPDHASGILAPGMLRRHYAPRARLRLGATSVESGEAFLAFGAPPRAFHLLSTFRFAGTSWRLHRTSSRCCACSTRLTPRSPWRPFPTPDSARRSTIACEEVLHSRDKIVYV